MVSCEIPNRLQPVSVIRGVVWVIVSVLLAIPASGILTSQATAQATTPAAPTALTVTTGNTDTALAVRWTAPSGPITGYVVEYSRVYVVANSRTGEEDDFRQWTNARHRGTTPSHTITGLRNGRKYEVRVRAKNEAENSPWTAAVSGRPASADTRLSALRVSGNTRGGTGSVSALTPAFSADTTNYSVTASNLVTSVTLSYTLAGPCTYTQEGESGYAAWCPTAKISKRGEEYKPFIANDYETSAVDLDDGTTILDLTVTAQDEKTKKTYTITVTRETARETDAKANSSPLSAPSAFTLTAGESRIDAAWGPPIPLEGRTLMSYSVRHKESNAPDRDGGSNPANGWVTNSFTPLTSINEKKGFTFSPLRNNVSYDVQVRARVRSDSVGTLYSPWTATKKATPVFEPITFEEVYGTAWHDHIQLRQISDGIGCDSVATCNTSFTLQRDGPDPNTRYVVEKVLLSNEGHLSITLRDTPFRPVLDDFYLYVRDMRASFGDWCKYVQDQEVIILSQKQTPIGIPFPYVSEPLYFLIGDASKSNDNRTITWRNTDLVWFRTEAGQTNRIIHPRTQIGFQKSNTPLRIGFQDDNRNHHAGNPLLQVCSFEEYASHIHQLERGTGPSIQEHQPITLNPQQGQQGQPIGTNQEEGQVREWLPDNPSAILLRGSGDTPPPQQTPQQTPQTPQRPPTLTRNLTLGAQGDDVRVLQRYLNSNGCLVAQTRAGSPGQETTYFGERTKQAVICYQTKYNIIPAQGVVGPTTRAHINSRITPQQLPTFTRDLTLGAQGEEVRTLQQYLNNNGCPVAQAGVGSSGQESTYFGEKTKQAVICYQTKHGITPAQGFFGQATRAHINSRVTSQQTPQ